jgi:hypothetical protein
VNIIDGMVDVDESGGISYRDDASDVLLVSVVLGGPHLEHYGPTAIRVDIIDGLVDVTESGSITTYDDLDFFALNDLAGITPTANHMNVIDGFVDVNQGGTINTSDDATDVKLVRLVGSVVDQVDIIEGHVDADENGVINTVDDAYETLLAFNVGFYSHDQSGLSRVIIVDGVVDVNENGNVNGADRLFNIGFNHVLSGKPDPTPVNIDDLYMYDGVVDVDQDGFCCESLADVKLVRLVGSIVDKADIIDGKVDVNENGVIESSDDRDDVLMLFDADAPIRVDVIDGLVDVTESGVISSSDDLPNTALTKNLEDHRYAEDVAIIDGMIDVDESGSITSTDDVADVLLLVP